MTGRARESQLIEVENLVFEYPGLRALDGVSFSLGAGTTTALVGPNGAGKSTLLRSLAGLARPLSGSIRLAGIDVLEQPRAAHAQLGYMADSFGLYDELSVERCLHYAALAHGLRDPAARERAVLGAQRVGLGERLASLAGELSRGMRQRLALALAILGGPRVLLLDEPASGLDPEARVALAELLAQLREAGATLLVSSHILAELEAYSTHMLMLRGGRVVEFRELAAAPAAGRALRVVLARPLPGLLEIVAASPGVRAASGGPSEVRFEFAGDAAAQHELLRAWLAQGLPICALEAERANLQDAYLAQLRGSAA